MTPETVHKKTKQYWDEVGVLEAKCEELSIQLKGVKSQIDGKMAKIRKLGELTADQMRQMDLLDEATDDKPATGTAKAART